MTKTRAIIQAKAAANREGKPMAILNLNPYSPLFVVREWNDKFEGSRDLLMKIYPDTHVALCV